jgi:hypothetical protein
LSFAFHAKAHASPLPEIRPAVKRGWSILLGLPSVFNTNEKIIVTVIASPTLHRPEPIRFGAPHGVQGEGRGNLVFA